MKIKSNKHLHYLYKDMFKNKWRAILSILGTFISLSIMMTGNFFIDSFYSAQFEKYQHYNNHSIVHNQIVNNGNDKEWVYDAIDAFEDVFGTSYLIFKDNGTFVSMFPIKKDDKNVKVNFSIFQTNENFNGQLVNTNSTVKATNLRAGRGITSYDIKEKNKVIVIDSITDDIMFQGNGVGNKIKFPMYEDVEQTSGNWKREITGYIYFEIVGVYRCDEDDYAQFKKAVDNTKTNDEVYYNAKCYIPISCSYSSEITNKLELIYLNNTINQSKFESINHKIAKHSLHYSYYTYNTLAKEIQTEISSIKLLLNMAIIILLVISVFLITQTMIFSIKENISEYGIKKALGASDERLSVDILLETLGYGFISFISAFIISVPSTLLILNYLQSHIEKINYSLIINSATILLCAMLASLTSCLASIVPIIYMSRKTIVEIIKFE